MIRRADRRLVRVTSLALAIAATSATLSACGGQGDGPGTSSAASGPVADTADAAIVTPDVAALEWPGEILHLGSSGESVTELQRALAALGFDPGPADGAFGRKTRRAVIAFQRASGLKGTGRVNRQTLGMINQALQGIGG